MQPFYTIGRHIVGQAGGLATDGDERIVEVIPEELHQKTPLVAGSRTEVGLYQSLRMRD